MIDPFDDLLAQANEALTPIPEGLVQRVERRIVVARRLRFAAGTAALAASVALVWLVAHFATRPERPDVSLAKAPPDPPAADAAPPPRVRVTFPADAGVTAVPVPAASPNVTILWLFPAPRPAAADTPSPPERNDS